MEKSLRKLIREILMNEVSPLLYGVHKAAKGKSPRKAAGSGLSYGRGWVKTREGEHRYFKDQHNRARVFLDRHGWHLVGIVKGKQVEHGPFKTAKEAVKSVRFGWF